MMVEGVCHRPGRPLCAVRVILTEDPAAFRPRVTGGPGTGDVESGSRIPKFGTVKPWMCLKLGTIEATFIQNHGRDEYHGPMIAQFALLLTLGMSLMWVLMPRDQVTSGFFRIQMLIVLGLSVLALLTLGHLTASTGESLADHWIVASRITAVWIAATGYAGSILWTLDRRPAGTNCIFMILAASLISLVLSHGGVAGMTSVPGVLLFASNLATAGVLGGAVTGMLLGHWYLTAPTMSIDPLKKLSVLFTMAVACRLVVSLAGWILAGQMLQDGTHYTWFALRWLAGILGPLAIAVMSVQILKYRNTQAATGVLFAGVILTFIGEMSAALLYSELHVPL